MLVGRMCLAGGQVHAAAPRAPLVHTASVGTSWSVVGPDGLFVFHAFDRIRWQRAWPKATDDFGTTEGRSSERYHCVGRA